MIIAKLKRIINAGGIAKSLGRIISAAIAGSKEKTNR